MLILDDPLLLAPDPADECPEHQVQREHTWESTRIDARRRFWTVRESLDRLIPLGERQFRRALAEFVATTTVSLIIKALKRRFVGRWPKGSTENEPCIQFYRRSAPSAGAPVPEEPRKKFRPLGIFTVRPFAVCEPSLARKPSTIISMPAGKSVFLSPRRKSALGAPASIAQFTTFPSASLTSM